MSILLRICYNTLMDTVKVLKVSDISAINLDKLVDSEKSLFVSATRSLNYQIRKKNKVEVYDFTQIQNMLNEQIREKDCLTESQMKYILFKTIDKMTDEKIKQAFKNSLSEIYDLFSNLLYAEVDKADVKLDTIKKKNVISTFLLFKLYVNYLDELEDLKKIYHHRMFNKLLREWLSGYNDVSLIGFSFLNDKQQILFKYIVNNNKLKYFITNDDFVVNDLIVSILKQNKLNFEIISEEENKITKFDSIRNILFDNNAKKVNCSDIEVYKPFFTREEEFKFVISKIVGYLKRYNTAEEIERECEKFAVVIVSDFAKQTKIFNELLLSNGVFISPEGNVFFSQDEFLNSKYSIELKKEERINVFRNFRRLEMYEPPKTLFNTTLGRFINEIYRISVSGLKLSNFNTLLYLNWLFKETKIDDIISEFNTISSYFEDVEGVEEWKNQIDKLIYIKTNNTFDKENSNNPLKSIKLGTLQFIRQYILFVKNTIEKLKHTKGNVKEHIKSLIRIIKDETLNEQLENELLLEFQEILKANEGEIDIDYEYFAQNFQSLISEYLSARKVKNNNIFINAINMESANHYEVVFVPMFEENIYPMQYRYEFPYSKTNIGVLTDNEQIENYSIPLNKLKSHSLKLAKHVFENLFRIAKEKIIFTRIESENGNPIDISLFGYDLKNKIENYEELDFQERSSFITGDEIEKLLFKQATFDKININELLGYYVCPKMFYYMNEFPSKNCYTDKFHLTLYCKALIYYKTFVNLCREKIYRNIEELKENIDVALETATRDSFSSIPFIDENIKEDIINTAKKQIEFFIQDKIALGKYKPKGEFKLNLISEEPVVSEDLTIYRNNILGLYDEETKKLNKFDISKSLDILVSSTGRFKTQKEHFWEIVDELKKSSYVDRVNSWNFLSFKLNTQLNSERYRSDGINRTKAILDEVQQHRKKGNYNFVKSSACMYCKFKNICMGVVDYE